MIKCKLLKDIKLQKLQKLSIERENLFNKGHKALLCTQNATRSLSSLMQLVLHPERVLERREIESRRRDVRVIERT